MFKMGGKVYLPQGSPSPGFQALFIHSHAEQIGLTYITNMIL